MKTLRLDCILENVLLNEYNDINNPKFDIADAKIYDKVYGNGFTLRELESLDIYDREDYCDETLNPIGKGLRRATYELTKNYILKISRGEHYYQSMNEYNTAAFSEYNELFTKVIYCAKDYSFMIMEKARRLMERDVIEILGMPLMDRENIPSLYGFLEYCHLLVANDDWKPRDWAKKVDQGEKLYKPLIKSGNKWFKQMFNLINFSKGRIDIFEGSINEYSFRMDNLGVVERDGRKQIIILDGGFATPFPYKG